MIDQMIELKNDQCVLIISDQKNEKTKNELLMKFPNAEKIDISDENLFVDPKITDSLMYNNKENWVFLETNRSNVISSVSSLLNSQINKETACRGASTFNRGSYYIDLDFDCNLENDSGVYFDIYGSAVGMEDIEICQT